MYIYSPFILPTVYFPLVYIYHHPSTNTYGIKILIRSTLTLLLHPSTRSIIHISDHTENLFSIYTYYQSTCTRQRQRHPYGLPRYYPERAFVLQRSDATQTLLAPLDFDPAVSSFRTATMPNPSSSGQTTNGSSQPRPGHRSSSSSLLQRQIISPI